MENKAKKTEYEIINDYIEQYIALKNMYKYSCQYIHKNDVPNKEYVLRDIKKYFSKQKKKIDNKCRKKFDNTLLGLILEHRPELVEKNSDKTIQ